MASLGRAALSLSFAVSAAALSLPDAFSARILRDALPDSFSAGRTAVVTGAAAGLGRAAALKCASLGMNVCLVDIDEANLATAESMVREAGAEVMTACIDVSDRAKVIELSEAVYERFGEVGFLLSNAGAGTGSPSALRDYDAWQRSLDVNLYS